MTLYKNCSNRSVPLNKMAKMLMARWLPELKIEKTFKRLLLNQRMDFEIIIQECFLGDPLPKLLKQSATLNKMAARAINRNNLLMLSSAKSVDRF